MRFAICNELFEGWEFRRVVAYLAGLGYDGVEIAPYTLASHVDEISPARRRELRAIARDHGMAITGLHWLLVKPAGLHLTHVDGAMRARTVDYLRRLIDFCADLGGETLVFGSPNQRSVPTGMASEAGWRLAREGLTACADAAESRGVTLCLEALPANLTNFLNTNAEVMAMVREIARPGVGMMVDVKSMCAEALPVAENIRACRGWFRHVHANDANLRGPGFGDVDFKPIVAALVETGYGGFVSVEVFDFKPDPETVARESLRYLRDCLAAAPAVSSPERTGDEPSGRH
jgi:sugar phosphate isomerase/epimerase